MFRFRLQVCTSMGGLTITTSCCCAIRAKAPVGRVPTNPSLKAGVSNGFIPVFTRTSLNWALVLVKTGISPDSACTEPVEVTDLQSVGQQTCSDYLLSIPKGDLFTYFCR